MRTCVGHWACTRPEDGGRSSVGFVESGWGIAGSIAGIVSAVVAVIGAIVAWAKAAKSSTSSAYASQAKREAIDLNQRIVAVLEAQNNLQESLTASIVSTRSGRMWSDARRVSGELYAIRNVSRQTLHVSAVSAVPTEADELLTVRTPVPAEVAPGDEIRVFARGRFTLSVQAVTVAWSTDGALPQLSTVHLD